MVATARTMRPARRARVAGGTSAPRPNLYAASGRSAFAKMSVTSPKHANAKAPSARSAAAPAAKAGPGARRSAGVVARNVKANQPSARAMDTSATA